MFGHGHLLDFIPEKCRVQIRWLARVQVRDPAAEPVEASARVLRLREELARRRPEPLRAAGPSEVRRLGRAGDRVLHGLELCLHSNRGAEQHRDQLTRLASRYLRRVEIDGPTGRDARRCGVRTLRTDDDRFGGQRVGRADVRGRPVLAVLDLDALVLLTANLVGGNRVATAAGIQNYIVGNGL